MSIATFNTKAPGIMRQLMRDFKLDVDSSAAILGNLGHESGGLSQLQEIKPTVSGSRGGYGWAQWTGPRRRAYEAYCARNNLSPSSDKANYAYLFVELSGEYAPAITAVKNAQGLKNKVIAFEKAYERAGVKAYASRETWAKRALAAYKATPEPKKPTTPTVVKTTGWLGILGAAWASIETWGASHPWLTALGITSAIFIALTLHSMYNTKTDTHVQNTL